MSPTRTLASALVAGAVILGLAGSAAAHVTVNPGEATKGGFEKLTFRVPTERDDASTTQLEVALPIEHPLQFVSVRPHDGWTVDVTKVKLAAPIKSDDGEITEAVSRITWKAVSADNAVKPGQFDEFEISVGPLPADTDSLEFKALQTYSDGQVVRWIETAAPGGAEPEHPAPVLKLTAGDSATGGAGQTPTTIAPSDDDDQDEDEGDGLARVLGGLGLLAGLAGLAIAISGRRR